MRALVLITITLLATSKIRATDSCPEGCLYCHPKDDEYPQRCEGCYKRRMIPITDFSDPSFLGEDHNNLKVHHETASKCDDTLAPEEEHCDIYLPFFEGCGWCEEGYASETSPGNCVPTKIDNCKYAYLIEGNAFCSVCKKGTPTPDAKSCVNFAQGEGDNCLLGVLSENKDKMCYMCEDGYMAVKGNCVKSTIEGCLVATDDGSQCQSCRYLDGYYSLDNSGTCQKVSK